MRKILAVLLSFFVVAALASCEKVMGDEKIVLITDKGDITDRSFNQGAYEGVKEFGKKYKVSYSYLKPSDANDEEYLNAIGQAISDGATIIVTPGYLFEGPINIAQEEYPEVKFILLDGSPANAEVEDAKILSNVVGIFYAEEQSGFLAGYAAVMDGYRKLGFMGGMAVPAVQRFGHGFVQGAAKAAEALELDDEEVTIEYLYTGDFKATTEVQAAAATMFTSGVEVIFACGGAVGQSVMAAAEEHDGKVIGVDVDQSGDSETVITSATKNLAVSVVQALEAIKDEEWDELFGGKEIILDVTNNGVSLPFKNSKFETFTEAQYNELFAALVDGTIEVSTQIGDFGDDGNAAKEFETAQVKVTVVPFG